MSVRADKPESWNDMAATETTIDRKRREAGRTAADGKDAAGPAGLSRSGRDVRTIGWSAWPT